MLSLKQLEDVCMQGDGAKQCKYLQDDPTNFSVFHCIKKAKSEKKHVDDKIEAFEKDCHKQGKDPHLQDFVPQGDNCSGYIYLRTIEMGYDIIP